MTVSRPRRAARRPIRFDEDDFSTHHHNPRRRHPCTVPAYPELLASAVQTSNFRPVAWRTRTLSPSGTSLGVRNGSVLSPHDSQSPERSPVRQVDKETRDRIPGYEVQEEDVLNDMPQEESSEGTWESLDTALQYQIFSYISGSQDMENAKNLLGLTGHQYEQIKKDTQERSRYSARSHDIYCAALQTGASETYGIVRPDSCELYFNLIGLAREYEYTSQQNLESARLLLRRLNLPESAIGSWVHVENGTLHTNMMLEYIDKDINFVVESIVQLQEQ